MDRTQKVSAVKGWSTSWTEKNGQRTRNASQIEKRHTLGDRTLKARFGIGEVAELLLILKQQKGLFKKGAHGYLSAYVASRVLCANMAISIKRRCLTSRGLRDQNA
jgi:hypothetical protein